VARTNGRETYVWGSGGQLQEKPQSEDLGVDGRVLNGPYGKSMGEGAAGLNSLMI